jgi:uncharacterized membrane protein YccF (DUF307 family)
MVHSVWRVAAVAYFLLGTSGVLMKIFNPAYAGGTRGAVTALLLMMAFGWWLFEYEYLPRLNAPEGIRQT